MKSGDWRFGGSAAAILAVLSLGAAPVWAASQAAPAAPAPAGAPASQPAPQPLSPEAVKAMRQALDQAPAHGFTTGEFVAPELDGLLASKDPAERARGEGMLKKAVVRYAKAVHSGRLAPADFDENWSIRPAAFDPAPALDQAIAQNAVPQWLASVTPKHPGYQQLMKQLAVYRAIDAKGGWKSLAKGKALKAGMSDPRVPALRARLAVEDPSVPAAPADPAQAQVMDDGLVQALKAFQRRHGMVDDGEWGRSTTAALNVPVDQRIAHIEVNMERLRWLPDALPLDRVEVNVPAAMTILYKGGQPTMVMKAAPGRKGDETPMLQSQIEGVVLNPPWNIPQSIAEKEIWPKQRENPGYFEQEQIEVIRTSDGGERLQQKAGPKSALGQVKFEFDNRYGVYLHDTPNKAAFERQTRTVSHGCVRLEKPRELAQALLEGQPQGSPEALQQVIDAGDTRKVALAKPVSVFLLYFTAFVGSDGQMRFLPDPYGWDAEVLAKVEPKA